MKTRNILLRFLNHLPNGNKERKQEMKSQRERIERIERNGRPHDGAGRMMAGAKEATTRMMPGESTAEARMMPAAKAAARMMSAAKAALLIILIVALPLVATSCRDRDDEPSAGGRLVTVSRLRVSIDGMQSAAEMMAARSAEMNAGRNAEMNAGRNAEMNAGRSAEMNAVRNGGDTRGGVQSRDGGEIRNGAQIRSGGETRNGGNTRADVSDPEPDKNGYVGVEKKKFVAGDVLHFMVALTLDDQMSSIYQVSNATLQADGTTWLFDTPLVLPEDATKTRRIQVFYDGTKRRYTYYSTNTVGDDTAANGNAYAANRDALYGIEDGVTGLTTYPDRLFVMDGSGDWKSITLTPDGTLAINPLPHGNSLVRISSIDNRLGAKVTAIHANTTNTSGKFPTSVSLYSAAATSSSAAVPSADDASAAAANGTVEAIIGYTGNSTTFLKTITVILDDGHKVIVPVPDGNKGQGGINGSPGRFLNFAKSYTYRLLLLPGSVSAEEVNGAAPSYQVRRDPAVPAGYIPIYTAEDLRKIGQKDGNDYLPAIVNGYLYTNASSALLDADAQKDPIVDPTTGAYTDSGYNEEATNAAIAANGLDPNADATSDGSIIKPDGSSSIGPLTFSLDARYILMNDIDLTPADGPAVDKDLSNIDALLQDHPEQLWTPIGDNTPFTGRFHGNGFTIRGMTINSGAGYLGLFGCIKGAVIYNVHMQDARVKGKESNCWLGSLVGSCDYSTISSCSATGCAVQSIGITYNIGGLVGNNNSGTLTRCHATACSILSDVQGLLAGGLVGRNQGTLASCYTAGCTADCTNSNNRFGGLVGYNNGTIYGCYATYAQKSGTATGNFGSLVGVNAQGITASSYAINATGSNLGLVGDNNGGTITACVSPFKTSSGTGNNNSGTNIPGYDDGKGQDIGGGSYWEIIQNGNGTFSGGYAPLTDDVLLTTLSGKSSFTADGNLADVRTLLVNNTGGDITDTDKGGGEDGNGNPGQLKTIPPGGLYTVKREWTASGIWGGSNIPGSLTVVLPRIDWTYNRE